MSIVRELDLCPHCLEKIYREVAKCQNQLKEAQQESQSKVTDGQQEARHGGGGGHKKRKCGKEGSSRVASKEEVDRCLASLPYIVPICDHCKLHRNISILKLPPSSCIVQKPEEAQKPK